MVRKHSYTQFQSVGKPCKRLLLLVCLHLLLYRRLRLLKWSSNVVQHISSMLVLGLEGST